MYIYLIPILVLIISISFQFIYDYNSFNKNGNKITSSLLTLNNIYEIDNINVNN